MLRVGLISYLPDTPIREKRKAVVHATLRDLLAVIPQSITVDVIAQNYHDGDEYIDGSGRVNYLHRLEGIGQCKARNQLLYRFYESNDDFMLYADDDMAFYDRYNASKLFQALQDNPDWFNNIDCFTGIEGRFTPFTAENDKLGLETKWVFKPMQFATSGEFRVLRNLNKYYGKEFYYDSNLKYGEDLHFRLKYLSQINSFVCRNIITRSRGLVDDMCTLDRMSKVDQETLYKQVTDDICSEFNILKRSNGSYDFSLYKCKIPYIGIDINDGSHISPNSNKTVKLF